MTSADRRIRVATYNIHACLGYDGRCLPSRIAAVIDELDAHVVGLQEVGLGFGQPRDPRAHPDDPAEQIDRISRLAGYAYVAAPTLELPSGPFGNALLTRLPIHEVRHADLSVAPHEPRGLLDVVLDWAGQPLRVLVTHLGLNRAERSRQLTQIFRVLEERPCPRTVLIGDFNEWVFASPRLVRLRRRFGRSYARASFPSHRPVLALDRVWVRPRGMRHGIGVHGSPLARVASDHLPAWVTLDL